MGLLRNALHRPERRDSFGTASALIPLPSDGYRSYAGPLVTDDTALAHIDVFKCRSLLCDAVAMLPMRAYRTRAWQDGNGAARTYAEKVPAQPLLMSDPMPGDLGGQFTLKHRVMDSLLADGNAYLEVAAVDQLGYPTVVMPIHPTKVRQVCLDSRGRTVYEMHDGGTLGAVRDGGTMVHILGYARAGALTGVGVLEAGRQGIALGMAAETFGARWFGDGAHPSGYLKSEGLVSEDDAKSLKRRWAQTYGGLSREPAVLYGGMEWHPISISPEESQFIETRKFQSGQIAALHRVPPHLVGDVDKTTSWGSGIEEMGLGFVTYSLGAWLARIDTAFTYLLPRGQFARNNVNALLKGRIQDRYAAYAIGRQWGFLSVNDIRENEDLPPIPDGDTYLQPLNMVDAAEAMNVLTPPEPPAAAELSTPPDDGAEE